MTAGWVSLIAHNIQDATRQKLASGWLLVQPTDKLNRPIAATAGGAGGLLSDEPVAIPVTNGAIPDGIEVPDTSLTMPANICLRFTVKDADGNPIVVVRGVQTVTGQAFNLDLFSPNTPPQSLIYRGPTGRVSIGTVYTGVTGSAASVTNSGTAEDAVLNFVLPRGATGSYTGRVGYASLLGAVCDLNVTTFSGTDNAAVLQAFLDTATPNSPVTLVIDGPCGVSGLSIPQTGYVHITGSGPDVVLCKLAGKNDSLIRFGPYVDTSSGNYVAAYDPGPSAPGITGRNVKISNITLDGNYAVSRPDTYRPMVDIYGFADVIVEDVTFTNAGWYSLRLGCLDGFRVTGNRFYPIAENVFPSASQSRDGLHLSGANLNGLVGNNQFHTVDDAIAINAAEGNCGPCINVTIVGNTFNGCPSWVRLYCHATVDGSYIQRIAIVGNTGSASACGLIVGNGITSNKTGKIKGVLFDGNTLYAPCLAFVGDHLQAVFSNSIVEGTLAGLIQGYGANDFTMEDITVDGLHLMRNPAFTDYRYEAVFSDVYDGSGTFGIVARTGTTTYRKVGVRNVTVGEPGFSAAQDSAAVYPTYVFIPSASTVVKRVDLYGNDPRFVSTLSAGSDHTLPNFAAGSVFGNLLGMTAIPDRVAGEGCEYRSNNAGGSSTTTSADVRSWIQNGVAKRLTLT